VIEKLNLPNGRHCRLHRITNGLIPDYFLLSFPKEYGEPSAIELSEIIKFGINRARQLAKERTSDPEAYTLVYSGYSARREKGWHVHIFLLGNRWKKARLYLILALKNLAQALGLRKDDAPRI